MYDEEMLFERIKDALDMEEVLDRLGATIDDVLFAFRDDIWEKESRFDDLLIDHLTE